MAVAVIKAMMDIFKMITETGVKAMMDTFAIMTKAFF